MGVGIPFRELLLIGATAGLVTFVVTGLVRGVAPAIGGLAYPRERDVHLIPTPRHRSNRLTEERGQVYRGEAFVYAEVTALAARLKAAERDVLAYPATAASGDPLSGIHASGIDPCTPTGVTAALPAPDAASISSQKKEDGQ